MNGADMTSIAVEQVEDGPSGPRTRAAARGVVARRGWPAIAALRAASSGWLVALAGAIAVAACGGGGGGGGGDGDSPGGGSGGPISAPTITSQPASVSASAGSSASFTVAASGGGLAYGWFRSTTGGISWTPIDGASAPTYTIGAVDASMNGHQFRVWVQNSLGSVVSSTATLTVAGASGGANITQQPADQTVVAGGNATFSVAAGGTSLSYQWQGSTDGSAWTNLPGATRATLELTGVALSENGLRYRVVISDQGGSVVSRAALLTVTAASGGGGGGGSGVPSTCVPANVLPVGTVIRTDSALATGGVAGPSQSATLTVVGPAVFQGQAVFETRVDTSFLGLSTRTFSTWDGATRLLTPRGAIARLGADPNNYTEATSVPRQPARYPLYALAAGQSETVTATADNTLVSVVNGTPGVPTTTVETTTTTYSFAGTETLTVPAGTFLTCKYTERVAGRSTSTHWLMVGYGVTVRSESTNSTQVLTAVSVNGAPLTRFP